MAEGDLPNRTGPSMFPDFNNTLQEIARTPFTRLSEFQQSFLLDVYAKQLTKQLTGEQSPQSVIEGMRQTAIRGIKRRALHPTANQIVNEPDLPDWKVNEPLTKKGIAGLKDSIYKFLDNDYNINELILDMVEGHVLAEFDTELGDFVLNQDSLNQVRFEADNHKNMWDQFRGGIRTKEGYEPTTTNQYGHEVPTYQGEQHQLFTRMQVDIPLARDFLRQRRLQWILYDPFNNKRMTKQNLNKLLLMLNARSSILNNIRIYLIARKKSLMS